MGKNDSTLHDHMVHNRKRYHNIIIPSKVLLEQLYLCECAYIVTSLLFLAINIILCVMESNFFPCAHLFQPNKEVLKAKDDYVLVDAPLP